jgi:hypothetical protein
VEILSKNPSGLLLYSDELAGHFGSMDAYHQRTGKDRPFWLQAKEGNRYTVDRKTSETLSAECCAISVLGGIQPEKIKSLSSSLSDDVRAYRAATLRRSKRLAVAASLRVAIASAEYLPCFQFAFRLRSRPSGARPSISVGREFGEVAPIAVVLDLVYPVRARNTQHGRNIGQPDPEITGSAAAPPTRRTTTASSDETMANATAAAQIVDHDRGHPSSGDLWAGTREVRAVRSQRELK